MPCRKLLLHDDWTATNTILITTVNTLFIFMTWYALGVCRAQLLVLIKTPFQRPHYQALGKRAPFRLQNVSFHVAKGILSGRNTYPFANPLPNGGKLRTADLSDANAYTNLETDA